jgi:integrase/recombinase XerD
MPTAFDSLTWQDALREFLLHLEATRAKKTRRYYDVQLRQMIAWAEENDITFAAFGKRHLDRYLVERSRAGKSQTTMHHDAMCAKVFFQWCVRYDLIDRSPLGDYEVRRAPRPPKHMPTEEEMNLLLTGIHVYWNVEKNPDAKYQPPPKRMFHRDRNYALILGLLDTACRIGEILSLQVEDYQPNLRQVTIRESKGREPRVLPVSQEWAEALSIWLRIRAKVMSTVPPEEDEGWLFISETGTRLDERRFLRALKNYLKWAGLTSNITLHSLRRYSLNRLAKTNLLAAQTIAGHKETKTTLIYTKLDADFVRDVHSQVGVVRGIVNNRRVERERKRRLV